MALVCRCVLLFYCQTRRGDRTAEKAVSVEHVPGDMAWDTMNKINRKAMQQKLKKNEWAGNSEKIPLA